MNATSKRYLVTIVAGASLAGCIRMPTGPNVMVLPGSGKTFDDFIVDDGVCRDWAARQTGVSANRAATETATNTAALGTVVGAATGAAIGAGSGSPATGAAVGAGAGLLGGTLVGASSAEEVRWSLQHRYDAAYMQCMYAKGNQIPLPRGTVSATRFPAPPPPKPPSDIPPPPRGTPPPPPPDRNR